MYSALVPDQATLAFEVRGDFVSFALQAVYGSVALACSKLHPVCLSLCSALVAFDES